LQYELTKAVVAFEKLENCEIHNLGVLLAAAGLLTANPVVGGIRASFFGHGMRLRGRLARRSTMPETRGSEFHE
jgi:hypothetical protein